MKLLTVTPIGDYGNCRDQGQGEGLAGTSSFPNNGWVITVSDIYIHTPFPKRIANSEI